MQKAFLQVEADKRLTIMIISQEEILDYFVDNVYNEAML